MSSWLGIVALVSVDDHALDEVGVAVVLVVDDSEDLGLHSYVELGVGERKIAAIAEDAVLEGGLVLVDGAAGSTCRVGPAHLVGLADNHVLAVLPVVGLGELVVLVVVLVAAEAHAVAVGRAVGGTLAVLVVLAVGSVLRAKVPVHVDGVEAGLPVSLSDGDTTASVFGARDDDPPRRGQLVAGEAGAGGSGGKRGAPRGGGGSPSIRATFMRAVYTSVQQAGVRASFDRHLWAEGLPPLIILVLISTQ